MREGKHGFNKIQRNRRLCIIKSSLLQDWSIHPKNSPEVWVILLINGHILVAPTTWRQCPRSYLICIAVILFLARALPCPSATPNDRPVDEATEPVPFSDTAVTAHITYLSRHALNTQLEISNTQKRITYYISHTRVHKSSMAKYKSLIIIIIMNICNTTLMQITSLLHHSSA